MKKILRLLALLVFFGALITWAVTGASRGWTKTSVEVKTLDPVTGIEGVSYQKKFIAGVVFLGAAAVVAVGLAGGSFLFRSKKSINSTNN